MRRASDEDCDASVESVEECRESRVACQGRDFVSLSKTNAEYYVFLSKLIKILVIVVASAVAGSIPIRGLVKEMSDWFFRKINTYFFIKVINHVREP